MTQTVAQMKTYSEYWAATMLRGFIAILAGTGVLLLPEMASTILLLPFAVVLCILCLAAYGTVDSAIVLVTSFMVPPGQKGRKSLRAQGIGGAIIGVTLFALVYDKIDLHWFLYLGALHAAGASMAEFQVARGTSEHHAANWCYVASGIAAVSAVALLFGANLEPRQVAWLLFAYLWVFGLNLFALSARMLFAERKVIRTASHPPAA